MVYLYSQTVAEEVVQALLSRIDDLSRATYEDEEIPEILKRNLNIEDTVNITDSDGTSWSFEHVLRFGELPDGRLAVYYIYDEPTEHYEAFYLIDDEYKSEAEWYWKLFAGVMSALENGRGDVLAFSLSWDDIEFLRDLRDALLDEGISLKLSIGSDEPLVIHVEGAKP